MTQRALVINRSLIYGALAVFLAFVFSAVLFTLQFLFQSITGRDDPPTLGIVVATLEVFSLFQPTLRILRNFVNRKFFGIEVDLSNVQRVNARLEKASHLPSHVVSSVGGYTGLELIARGGMGEIYKARHPTLNREVAIKILSIYFKDDSAFTKRFSREAELMARLRHPNIITIYDYGEQDGLPYIVMEYLCAAMCILLALGASPVAATAPQSPRVANAEILPEQGWSRDPNVIWHDDPQTQAAVRALEEVLGGDEPLAFEATLQGGWGLLSNNVLHTRSGFEEGGRRLLNRARYYDRIVAA